MTQLQIQHAKIRGLYERENYLLSQIKLWQSIGLPAQEFKRSLIGIQHQLQASKIDYIIALETEQAEKEERRGEL